MIRNFLFVIAICAMVAEVSAAMKKDTCGVPINEQGLIVRGQSFPRGAFPWSVALMHTGWSPPKFFCSGTVISRTFVISAAHCIFQKNAPKKFSTQDIIALFGAHELNNPYEARRIAKRPKNIFIHDEWNPATTEYDADLSLLEFEKESIHYSAFIQPICFWDSENKLIVNQTEGIVTGWGKSENNERKHENVPKLVTVTLQSNELCFLKAKDLVDLSSVRTFCAGLGNGTGVCTGDSGGGLIFKYNGAYHLRGIVSSSLIKDGDCDVNRNAVYTDVPKYEEWIEETTGVLKHIFCNFKVKNSQYLKRTVDACEITEAIKSRNFFIVSPISESCESFTIDANKNGKFLPKNIADNMPNLKEMFVYKCSLNILGRNDFKKLHNLQFLLLQFNEITRIEPNAFDDLVSLKKIWLNDNLIETLNENIFAAMISLEEIYLQNNKIKFLSPSAFKILGGKLDHVDLRGNNCSNKSYLSDVNLNELESDLKTECNGNLPALTTQDSKNVMCRYANINIINFNMTAKCCYVYQSIDSEDYHFLETSVYSAVEAIEIVDNKDFKFMPRNISKKFPGLKFIDTVNCSLTVVRDHYFENMQKLQILNLRHNMLTSIEPDAFKDLISVEVLSLRHNMLETLSENLFAAMAKVEKILLQNNKIKFLSPKTFMISGGNLNHIDLSENICVNQTYHLEHIANMLESELKIICT